MRSASMSASTPSAEFRAAGTDLSERRRSGVSQGPLIDITARPDTIGIDWGIDGAARIGAFTTIAAIAADARINGAYPGLAAAALGLATPQIRHLATLGGNLAQRSRCWYYRNPHIACLKKGGPDCPARSGNHLYSVAFDLGPCVAPHPSTMAAALLAYDAKIITDRRSGLTIGDLLGDGSNGAADHALAPGEMIRAEEAYTLGLLNQLVPPEQLMPATYELAQKIAVGPPIAIRLAKRALYHNQDVDLRAALEFETFAQNVCRETEDAREGIRAFVEKRPPQFQGR